MADRLRFVYRIVRSDPPVADEFVSDRVRGRPLRDLSDDTRRRWEGLSVWATDVAAFRAARRYPSLGRHVAEVAVGGEIRLEPSGRPGHLTAYGEPQAFVTRVVRVMVVPQNVDSEH